VIVGALHIQIGDNLEVLSNDQLKSLVHRVKELVDEEHPKMYRENKLPGPP
jgi:isopenicillin N synthase-like dioxygenase